jgi:hypothetical protein
VFAYRTFFKNRRFLKENLRPSGCNDGQSGNLHFITASCELIWNQWQDESCRGVCIAEKLFCGSPSMKIRIVLDQLSGRIRPSCWNHRQRNRPNRSAFVVVVRLARVPRSRPRVRQQVLIVLSTIFIRIRTLRDSQLQGVRTSCSQMRQRPCPTVAVNPTVLEDFLKLHGSGTALPSRQICVSACSLIFFSQNKL